MPASASIFQGEDSMWYFNIKGGNGEIVVNSESYGSESDAKRGLDTAIACTLEVATQAFSTGANGETPSQ